LWGDFAFLPSFAYQAPHVTESNESGREAIQHAAGTDVGLRRANNQDSFVVVVTPDRNEWLRRGHLFVVADGMGAHAAGELASKMATDFVSLTYYKTPDESPIDAIRNAFRDANDRVYSRGQANPDFHGMGTTCTALLLLPEGAVAAHVGDSRVYRLRGNRFEQLSFDHSLAWEMQAIGKLPESQIELHVPKNIITRSLGPYPSVQVDLEGPFPLEVGDTFLLCSDGLTGQVDDDEIGAVLLALPPDDAVRTLIDLTNLRGGPDNVTIIVTRVADPTAIGRDGADAGTARARPNSNDQTVNTIALIVLGVLLLATASMAFLGKYIAAGATGAGALIAGLYALIRHYTSDSSGRIDIPRLGKGPYRSINCDPTSAVVEKLAKVVKQLRDVATDERWRVDWGRFNALDAKAMEAIQKKDYLETVRRQCHAISFMMEEIRQQPSRKKNVEPTG